MNARLIYYSALAVLAAAGATIAEALGGWDTALQTLVIFMAIDYVTGILCALIWKRSPKSTDGTFESKASLKGLIRKGAILLVVLVAARLDMLMGTEVTRLAVILFFIANDGFSIIENLGIMGVPMPQPVKDAFALLRKKSEGVPIPAVTAPAENTDSEIYPGQTARWASEDSALRPEGGYQPKHATIDLSNPPSGGSSAQDD